MQSTNGAALNLNSLDEETGGQYARAAVGNGAPVRLDETGGGKVAEGEIMERKDSLKVLNGSVTDCSNDDEEEEEEKEEEEGGSFSEGEDSRDHEVNRNFPGGRDNKVDTDGQPLLDEGRVPEQEHADCERPFTSTSSIFWKSANSSGSRAAVLKSFSSSFRLGSGGNWPINHHTSFCAAIGRGCSKCTKCNGSGTFPGKVAGDYWSNGKSSPVVEEDHGLLPVEGSKPRPVKQRSPNVSEMSWGMWLKCFVRFFLGCIVEDLITSNPLRTSYNVVLVPISFVLCFFGDMAFFVVAIIYDLVFVAIYIFLYMLWVLNGVVALCWHFLQLSSFSTRCARLIFEFTWDMRAAYKDDVHCCKLPSR